MQFPDTVANKREALQNWSLRMFPAGTSDAGTASGFLNSIISSWLDSYLLRFLLRQIWRELSESLRERWSRGEDCNGAETN